MLQKLTEGRHFISYPHIQSLYCCRHCWCRL